MERIDGRNHSPILSLGKANGIYPIIAWSHDDKRILVTAREGYIKILALDSDGDGVPDYRDVFPTLNNKFLTFLILTAAAAMIWLIVFLSHRPRRLKAP